jgi:integrase
MACSPGTTVARRTGYVRRVFERWAQKLKEPRLHMHTMRHTFGSELARRGVQASTIAALMGHSLASAGANAITHH